MLIPAIQDFSTILYYVAITLILTIIIELATWRSIIEISKEFKVEHIWLAIIIVNVITNPILNIMLSIMDPLREKVLLEIGFEIIIMFVEASLLYFIYRKAFRKFLIHSTIMNTTSYCMGLLIFRPPWF
jgi:hypothetical protein